MLFFKKGLPYIINCLRCFSYNARVIYLGVSSFGIFSIKKIKSWIIDSCNYRFVNCLDLWIYRIFWIIKFLWRKFLKKKYLKNQKCSLFQNWFKVSKRKFSKERFLHFLSFNSIWNNFELFLFVKCSKKKIEKWKNFKSAI